MRPRLQRHLHGVPATETAPVSRPAGRAASRTQPRLQRLRPWLIAGALSLGWHVVAVLPDIAKLGEPPERELELTYSDTDEETQARAFLARKRTRKPTDQRETARVFRMLARAGFSGSTAMKVLKQWDLDPEALAQLAEADL